MSTQTKLLSIFGTLVILVATFVGGIYIGYQNLPLAKRIHAVEADKPPASIENLDFSPFWKTWLLLEEKYAADQEVPTNEERLWGAIQGLVNSYEDPYTTFFPPEEAKIFEETITGQFSGIGVEVGLREGFLTVIAPLKDTPAYKAGLKAGDIILQIDDTSALDMSIDNAVNLIRGEKGTTVKLTVAREGAKEKLVFPIMRDTIRIPVIEANLREDGVFLIEFYNFSLTSPNLMKNALLKFKTSGSRKLVLDLRDNPGGYLDASVDIASLFLPQGKVVVQEKSSNSENEEIYRSKGYHVIPEGIKMVILVNNGSASASEILAGALREHGIATLVGEKTFGKGSVQELMPVTKNTSLKITVAQWLTPNGVSISRNGLVPDIEIKDTREADESTDAQLEKAIEIVNAR